MVSNYIANYLFTRTHGFERVNLRIRISTFERLRLPLLSALLLVPSHQPAAVAPHADSLSTHPTPPQPTPPQPTPTQPKTNPQMACPQRSYGRHRMVFYLARFVFALLLLEWAVHNLPVFALARSGSLK